MPQETPGAAGGAKVAKAGGRKRTVEHVHGEGVESWPLARNLGLLSHRLPAVTWKSKREA